jgi:hypothetical protein
LQHPADSLPQEWSGFMERSKLLAKAGITAVHDPEIKPYMRDFHAAVKKASSFIYTKTPWSHYLNSSNYSNNNSNNNSEYPNGLTARPLPNAGGLITTSGLPPQMMNVASIPSTPLSAALGPAAAAVSAGTGKGAFDFLDRTDRGNPLNHNHPNATLRHGPDTIFGKR